VPSSSFKFLQARTGPPFFHTRRVSEQSFPSKGQNFADGLRDLTGQRGHVPPQNAEASASPNAAAHN